MYLFYSGIASNLYCLFPRSSNISIQIIDGRKYKCYTETSWTPAQNFRQCSHKCIDNESKKDKSQKDNIQFVIAGKNATKSLDTAKKPLNLVALFVQLFIIVPRIFAIAFWRNNRDIAKFHCQSSCLIPFVGPIHQKVNRVIRRTELLQKSTAFRAISTVSGRQRKDYPISIRCGDHMKFGVPPTTCSSDGLRSVFFSAPIPSG